MGSFCCPACGHVTSLTLSPNGRDGYWVTDAQAEELYPGNAYDFLRTQATPGVRCPKCGVITLDRKPPSVLDEDAVLAGLEDDAPGEGQ